MLIFPVILQDLLGSSMETPSVKEDINSDIGSGNLEKDQYLLEKRFVRLSDAYRRDFITCSDFLNLNEQNILHTLPKKICLHKYLLSARM